MVSSPTKRPSDMRLSTSFLNSSTNISNSEPLYIGFTFISGSSLNASLSISSISCPGWFVRVRKVDLVSSSRLAVQRA
ncbi:hypothetical protein KCV07_g475, partial [Aureobasidium melanogenum]